MTKKSAILFTVTSLIFCFVFYFLGEIFSIYLTHKFQAGPFTDFLFSKFIYENSCVVLIPILPAILLPWIQYFKRVDMTLSSLVLETNLLLLGIGGCITIMAYAYALPFYFVATKVLIYHE